MSNNNGSVSAVLGIGKGGKKRAGSKYNHGDDVLRGFCAMPGATVNEVAVEYFDWIRERYKNAPKRAYDLLKLGYLEQLNNRTCRFSGKDCHTFKITQRGVDYLRKNNKLPVVKSAKAEEAVDVPKAAGKPSFASLREALN